MKTWIAEIATPSQLVDTVERIGGPLSRQMEWLSAAGVALAPRDAKREIILDAEDEALLDRFDRYGTVAALDAEIIKARQEEIAMRRAAPGIPASALSTGIARFNELERARSVALREAGLDEASWKRERSALQGLFRAYGVSTAHRMLRTSATAVARERDRYASSSARAELRADVAPLHAKEREVATLTARHFAKSRRDHVSDIEATIQALQEAEASCDALRKQLAIKHPILLDPTIDIEALAAGDARHEIERVAGARLADIEAMHRNVDDDTTLVLRLDRVTETAKAGFDIFEGSAIDRVLNADSKRLEDEKAFRNTVSAGVAVSLGLLSGGAGGVIGFAGSVLGTSLGVLSTIDSAHEYGVEASAARTDFDRARALSSDDPSAFWLAVDVVGTVLDVGAFAKTFAGLHEAATAALRARTAVEIEDARATIAAIAGTAPEGSITHADDVTRAINAATARGRAQTELLEAHAALAATIRAQHPTLDDAALAGLVRLDDATRSSVLRTFGTDSRALARLGTLINATGEGARGLERLRGAVDEGTFSALAKEIATWRRDERARSLLERLGNARITAEDEGEIAHALASRRSPSAQAAELEDFARERLPITRSDADAFARRHGVPIAVNEAGSSRDVRIYFTARDGVVDDIRLEVGARATLGDLEGHREVLEKIAIYRGLLRRAARLVDAIRGAPRTGTAAFEAAGEIEKLPERIRAWQLELAGTASPERAALLQRDIQALEAQLEDARRVFATGGNAEGRGFVAALDAESYRIEQLREWPGYRDVARLEGRTLEEVMSSPELRRTFEAHYHESGRIEGAGVRRISRHNGQTGDVPLLREQNDGVLRFVVGRESEPPIPLPNGSNKEVIAFFERNSQSWMKWREVLVSEGVMSEREISALLKKALARENAPATVEHLREILKSATRDRLVSHCFESGMDAAASHARLRGFVSKLNPSDQGSIAERWYAQYSEVYLGRKVEAHVQMLPADNPSLVSARTPDNLYVSGRELGEVKSTTNGLNKHDKDQISAMLEAIKNGKIDPVTQRPTAVVRKDGATHLVDGLKVTFIDPEAAAASTSHLRDWLAEHKRLVVEVFDGKGKLHRIDRAYLNELASKRMSLEEQLKAWAKQ